MNLCIETWKKFLPEYEIIRLDYTSARKWLKEDFDEVLYRDFSLPMQADAIRAGLLSLYGGIWLDADTIITSANFRQILEIQVELVMIETHLAFIKASNSRIINAWFKDIKWALSFYKNQKYHKNQPLSLLFRYFHPRYIKHLDSWDYLGNFLLNRHIKRHKNSFIRLNRLEINAMPELKNKNNVQDYTQNYQEFYFENDFSDKVLDKTKGIVLLHNSWTPESFLQMNETEFLSQNNTLANTLKRVLERKVR